MNFYSWTFFFGITCILALICFHRLSFIEERRGRLAGVSSVTALRPAGLFTACRVRQELLRISREPPQLVCRSGWISRSVVDRPHGT